MVERAPGLALELHALLGKKVRRAAKSEVQLVRQKAFTLLVNVYEECRSAVEYIRRHEGDAASYTPSLFLKKRRGRSSEALPVDGEESSTVPIPIRTPVTELAPTG